MNSKILLLSIAVISVGLFAMPTTLSIFSGQHSFDKAGDNKICSKCHSDIKDELTGTNSIYHRTLLNEGNSNECIGCHTTTTVNASTIPMGIGGTGNFTNAYQVGLNLAQGTFTMANGTNVSYGTSQVHAAVTIECIWCHSNASSGFTTGKEAHDTFYSSTAAGTVTYLRGANEACIGCHTKARVNITWVRMGGYNYTYYFETQTSYLELNTTKVNITTGNS